MGEKEFRFLEPAFLELFVKKVLFFRDESILKIAKNNSEEVLDHFWLQNQQRRLIGDKKKSSKSSTLGLK